MLVERGPEVEHESLNKLRFAETNPFGDGVSDRSGFGIDSCVERDIADRRALGASSVGHSHDAIACIL